MKRREFLRNSTLAGATTFVAAACNTSSNPSTSTEATERAVDDFVLNETTIDELQEKMKQGTYTSEQLTQLYLERINAIDKNGHQLNSVIELNPDAITIAKQLDAERKAGKLRGAMHGIPILIKSALMSTFPKGLCKCTIPFRLEMN